MYNTLDFADIDYLLNYIGLKLLRILQDLVLFSPFFVLSINFFVLPIISLFQAFLILAGVSFTLNTNLLLILLV